VVTALATLRLVRAAAAAASTAVVGSIVLWL
jgi:hypothetical protein